MPRSLTSRKKTGNQVLVKEQSKNVFLKNNIFSEVTLTIQTFLTFDLYCQAGVESGPHHVDRGAEEAARGARTHADTPLPTVHNTVSHPAHLQHKSGMWRNNFKSRDS